MTPEQKAAIRARLDAFKTMIYGDRGTRLRWEAMIADCSGLLAALDQCELENKQLEIQHVMFNGLMSAKYLNPECAESGCQWLKAEQQLTEARRLIAKLHTLVDELNNAAARYKAHWEEARGKAMLEVAFELKALLAEFPMEEKK